MNNYSGPKPTKSTLEAMKETDNSSKYKSYSDEKYMWRTILNKLNIKGSEL